MYLHFYRRDTDFVVMVFVSAIVFLTRVSDDTGNYRVTNPDETTVCLPT